MKFIWNDVRGAFGLLLPIFSAIFSDNELAIPAATGDVIFGPLQLNINKCLKQTNKQISVMEYQIFYLS